MFLSFCRDQTDGVGASRTPSVSDDSGSENTVRPGYRNAAFYDPTIDPVKDKDADSTSIGMEEKPPAEGFTSLGDVVISNPTYGATDDDDLVTQF